MRASAFESRWLRIMLPLVTAAVACGFWAFAVKYTGTKIFPSPAAVMRAVVKLGEGKLLWHYIFDSLTRVFAGYLLGIVVGVPLGFFLGWSQSAASAINPLIQMLRPISPLAWMPLAVIWFGVSNAAPIFLIFMAAIFPIAVAAMNGVRNVPVIYLQVGRNFGLSPFRLMTRIVAPAVLPRLVIGLRIAFGISWVVLVASEMIAVDSGLGYLIIDARNAGKRYDLVVAGMLIIGILGLILDTGIRRVEQFVGKSMNHG